MTNEAPCILRVIEGCPSPDRFLVHLYYRILQVAIFAIAAALHSPWHNDFSISREAADGWAGVTPKTVIRTTSLSGTAVTYHPEYHDFQASQARRGLEEAAALGGFEFLRADVRWSAVLPDGRALRAARPEGPEA